MALNDSYLEENLGSKPFLDPARQQKAKEYARLKRRLSLAELALAGSLLLLVILSGLSTRLAGLIPLPPVPAAAAYFIGLMLAYGLLTAPLSYYGGFVLPRRYGLSTQKLSGWLGDTLKAAALGLVLGVAIVAAVYWFLGGWPQLWWLLTWGLVILLSLLLTILAPVVIVPLFYKMEPLRDEGLKERLKNLASKAKASISNVYTLEFSSKGTAANAALMGAGKTRRIALSDTLLDKYSPEEIEVIMAHELGHHRNKDFMRIFLYQAIILFVSFWLTHIIAKATVPPLGFSGIDDVAALPLLVLVFAGLSSLILPLSNTYVRSRERAADDFALRLTGNPQAFITMMTKLTDQNLAEARPSRWVERLLYDHPSYASRLAYASSISAHKRAQGEQNW